MEESNLIKIEYNELKIFLGMLLLTSWFWLQTLAITGFYFFVIFIVFTFLVSMGIAGSNKFEVRKNGLIRKSGSFFEKSLDWHELRLVKIPKTKHYIIITNKFFTNKLSMLPTLFMKDAELFLGAVRDNAPFLMDEKE